MSEDRSNLKKKILSVVVSVYNEEQALKECYRECWILFPGIMS